MSATTVDPSAFAVDTDTRVQEILLAASNHDVVTLEQLLRDYEFPDCNAVDVQDSETGFCPLHAAVAACDVSDDDDDDDDDTDGKAEGGEGSVPHDANGLSAQEDLVAGARETIQCLLQNGAIWNQLDASGNTPGCLALELGLRELYGLMVDAGVRAEVLLNRLQGYEQLDDDDDDDEEGEGKDAEIEKEAQDSVETTDVIKTQSISAAQQDDGDVPSERYLASALTHTGDKLLDDQNNGVMMEWEAGIMKRSADALLDRPDLTILNIGFGMGIIDSYIQEHTNKPAAHHIIEAHPSVLADMRAKGWFEKANVTIHEGKWQDILPDMVAENQVFDAIYFDTFAEDYAQFRDFFSEHVIGVLDPSGKWSFFNGMGADRQISYDVYQKVVEIDLFESGFDVEWSDVAIPTLEKEWEGVKRKYWNVAQYRLPVCKFMD